MDYRKIYLKIISKAKHENRKKLERDDPNYVYYESHHILPKSLFPLWAKRKSNLVLLTAREHFFCHQLLEKIYPNSNMFLAVWYLANDDQNKYCIKGSKEYQKLKERYHFSESHLENIRQANIFHAKNMSIEERQKRSEAQKKLSWFTNGIDEGRFEYCPDGWVKGRNLTNNPKNKGKTLFTNGVTQLYADTCPDGFWKGQLYKTGGKNKGMKFFHKGEKEVMAFECPLGYEPGRSDNYKSKNKGGAIHKGKKFFNNGIKQILSFKCPDGWKEGKLENKERSKKAGEAVSKALKGKTWFTDGKINKLAFECPEGFFKGKTLKNGEIIIYGENKKNNKN